MAVVLILIILIAAMLFSVLLYCYLKTFYVSKRLNKNPLILLSGEQYEERKEQILPLVEEAMKLPFIDLYTTSHDGYRLHAKYYEVNPDATVEIMVHGYRSIAIRDFSGGLQAALKAGHNVLLIDQRAHGKSEGRCLTFGILERKDCLTWINYILNRNGNDKKILLTGISMGAATVLMAAELDLPENVIGIVADSGYTSPREIIEKVIVDMKLPPKPLMPFVKTAARIFGGFNLDECSAPDALKNCKIPVWFIHGEDDRFVPMDMSKVNFNACASKKLLLTVPDAGHGLSFLVDNDAYTKKQREFYDLIFSYKI